jgi:hypothetical protein
MQIRTRMCISADGYVTTADGWPVQLADPAFVPGESYGFPQFQKLSDAVLMGRTTFEPALGAERWPWPDLDAFVLGSHRPAGTPDHVVIDSAPERLLEILPKSRRARQTRSHRAAVANRRRDAPDALAQHRHRAGARGGARPSRRRGADHVRGVEGSHPPGLSASSRTVVCRGGCRTKSAPCTKTPPKWAASENQHRRFSLSDGQPVLVEFQEVVGGRQQPPLGQHG